MSKLSSAPPWWKRYWQIIPVGVLLWGLDAADKLRGGAAAGMTHAPVVNRVSGIIGGAVAATMNHWLARHQVLADVASGYYIVAQGLVAGLIGVLLLRAGVRSFWLHRNALIACGVIGLVSFWLYPVAPPRMLPGYQDVTAASVPLFHSVLESRAADQYASLPSLHVTWALWVAVAAQSLLRGRVWRLAIWAYPAVTTVDVLATGNHYMLDAATAPAVLAVGYAAAAVASAITRRLGYPIGAARTGHQAG